jgi:hypothetical protein
VAGALPREQEAARIAAMRVSETVPLRLLIDALYRRCGATAPLKLALASNPIEDGKYVLPGGYVTRRKPGTT